MRTYKWCIKKDIYTIEKDDGVQERLPFDSKLTVKCFFPLLIIWYVAPLRGEEGTRGTIHYFRRYALLIGFMRRCTEGAITEGFAFFDFGSTLFFVICFFIGGCYESLWLGVILAALTYAGICFGIEGQRQKQMLRFLERVLTMED